MAAFRKEYGPTTNKWVRQTQFFFMKKSPKQSTVEYAFEMETLADKLGVIKAYFFSAFVKGLQLSILLPLLLKDSCSFEEAKAFTRTIKLAIQAKKTYDEGNTSGHQRNKISQEPRNCHNICDKQISQKHLSNQQRSQQNHNCTNSIPPKDNRTVGGELQIYI